MERKFNNELNEFNKSFKNQGRIKKSSGFAFVSCPDFQNDGAKYSYVESIGIGLPLYMKLAAEELKMLELEKPVHVFLSDHELNYSDLLNKLGETCEELKQKLELSLGVIRNDFPEACFLSEKYSYESVVSLRLSVPRDSNFENEVAHWGSEDVERSVLEDRYINKFSQLKAFMMFCKSENLCPVLIYSKFTFKIVSQIRSELHVPVLFLDVME